MTLEARCEELDLDDLVNGWVKEYANRPLDEPNGFQRERGTAQHNVGRPEPR